MDQDFTDELNRRLAILSNPDYEDASTIGLGAIDYIGIVALIILSLLIFAWGWY
ncbi:UNVERIFIED_CONTAM: hypothetical protein ABID98_001207 [Brevibacillus sp. OAP136]